jgi:hypothetical protein
MCLAKLRVFTIFRRTNMLKIIVGFVVFAAIALYVLTRGGGDIDLSGEKHGVEQPHAPATSASAASAAMPAAPASTAVPAK